MMKWTKKLFLGLGVLSLAVMMTACGDSSKEEGKSNSGNDDCSGDVELTISTWNYDTTPEFEALINAFEKENPNIKIKPIDIAADQYDDKLTTMLSGGDKTDILTMKNLLSYSNYALRDQLVDLTDHVKDVDTDKAQGMYDYFDVNGKTYAQPYRTDFWVLYYNKKLLEDAGVELPENLSWDDYEKLAKDLTSGEDSDKVYGAYHHTWRSVLQALSAAQNNKNILDPSYEYLKPDYERTLRMQKDGSIMDFGTAQSTKTTYASQFETQKAAMMPMGTWYMAGVRDSKEKGDTDVEWGIAPLPQKGTDGKITTFGSPTAFAINKNSKNQACAQKFIDFATGEEGAKILAEVGVVPAYKTDEIDEIYFSGEGMPSDDLSKKAFSPDKISVEMPVDKNAPTIDGILKEEHELILVGDETPAKGISNMNKRVKQETE